MLIARALKTLHGIFEKKIIYLERGLLTPVVSEPFQHQYIFFSRCWFSVHCRNYGAAGIFIYKTEFYTAIDFCRKILVVDFGFSSLLFSHTFNMPEYMRQS